MIASIVRRTLSIELHFRMYLFQACGDLFSPQEFGIALLVLAVTMANSVVEHAKHARAGDDGLSDNEAHGSAQGGLCSLRQLV